jgi:hypothetical protein
VKSLTKAETSWTDDAACKDLVTSFENDIFFESESNEARSICDACPVKRQCLEYALNNHLVDGWWGGVNESELRRNQSMGADGKRHDWNRPVRCAWCGPNSTRFLEVVEYHRTKTDVRCTNCELEWTIKRPLKKRKANW